MEDTFAEILMRDLENRISDQDGPAAVSAARLAAQLQRAESYVDTRDTLIAGIAVSRNSTIASSNVRHFLEFGVKVVNSWVPA